MYCLDCGKVIKEGDKYCSNCGNNIENNNKDSKDLIDNYSKTHNDNFQRKNTSSTGTTVLVLGVLSTFFSCLNYLGVIFVHLFGIALGIAGIIVSSQHNNSSDKNIKTGKIFSIIGLSLGVLAVIIVIIMFM